MEEDMTKWEYTTQQVTMDWGADPDPDSEHGRSMEKCDLSDWLDGWGEYGWELVSIWSALSDIKGMEYWAVFKRPFVEQPESVEVK